MGIIASTSTYVRQEQTEYKRAVSENILSIIGGSINYCLDQVGIYAWTVDAITSSGTWNCPASVNRVFIYGCGAGGGGGGGFVTDSNNQWGGNGGGASIPHLVNLAVTPSTAYTVTIGAAGSGGAYNNSGSNGGFTSFGSLYKYLGGVGGRTKFAATNISSNFYNNLGGVGSDTTSSSYTAGSAGNDFNLYTGGAYGGLGGGGGGAASLGNGGGGGGATNGSAGSGYGSGGGGGGTSYAGGNGSAGVLYVIYLTNL